MRPPLAPPLLLVLSTLACADPPTAPDASSAPPALPIVVVDMGSAATGVRAPTASAARPALAMARAARPAAARPPLRVTILDIVDVGALACCSEARGVNSGGRVVGVSTTEENEDHAFRWRRASGMRDLGTLGGTFSEANAINSLGHVVGTSETEDGAVHAFVWPGSGSLRDLGVGDGFDESSAEDINDRGQVAGTLGTFCFDEELAPSAAGKGRERARTGMPAWVTERINVLGGTAHHRGHHDAAGAGARTPQGVAQPECFSVAALWESNGEVTELGALAAEASSFGTAVNRAGQVVGLSQVEGEDAAHAFIWDHSTDMVDIGTLGGPLSAATDINGSGRVVGFSTLPEPEDESGDLAHAFLWQDGQKMLDLGTLPGHELSLAAAINDASHVVGLSGPNLGPLDDDSFHGFFWHPDIGMLDFGPDFEPTDIDDAGHMVGNLSGIAVRVTYRIDPNAVPVVSRLQAGIYPPGSRSGLTGVWLRVRLSDPDDFEGWTWRIDWGDDVVSTPTVDRKGDFVFLRRQAYAEPGTYRITVTATDPFGATSTPVSTTVNTEALVAAR